MNPEINQNNSGKLLVLWLTNDCNLNCKYCYAKAGEKKEYMVFDTARRAIDGMGGASFKLQLTGGEPLMNINLVRKIHDYITEKGIRADLQIQTNGTVITPEVAKEIRRMRIAVGVSLDGGIEVNEALRGQTGKVIEGIQNLAVEGIMINLNCVLTRYNVESLPKLIDLAFYLGNVRGVGLDLLRKTGRASSNEILLAEPNQIRSALWAAYERTIQLKRITGRSIIIREIEDAKKRLNRGGEYKNYCHAACGMSIVVLPDGNTYPCGSLTDRQEYWMGNMNDGGIRAIAIKAHKSYECNGCKYQKLCPGGCPSRLIVNYENKGYSPEDCILRKTAFEIAEVQKNK